jgi:hypothetical protein
VRNRDANGPKGLGRGGVNGSFGNICLDLPHTNKPVQLT